MVKAQVSPSCCHENKTVSCTYEEAATAVAKKNFSPKSCFPIPMALDVAHKLDDIKSKIDIFQSLKIKKSHMDYEILVKTLRDIIESEGDKPEESKRSQSLKNGDHKLSEQCLRHCSPSSAQMGAKLEEIRCKLDEFQIPKKGKAKVSRSPDTLLNDINQIITEKIVVKNKTSSQQDENEESEKEQQPKKKPKPTVVKTEVEEPTFEPKEEEVRMPRRSKRHSNVFTMENGAGTSNAKKAKIHEKNTDNSKLQLQPKLKTEPAIEKEEGEASASSSQNSFEFVQPESSSTNSKVCIRLQRLAPEEIETATKKETQKETEKVTKKESPKEVETVTKEETPKEIETVAKKETPNEIDKMTEKETPNEIDKMTEKETPNEIEKITEKETLKEIEKVTKKESPKEIEKVAKMESPKEIETATKGETPKEIETVTKEETPKEMEKVAEKECPKEIETAIKKEIPKEVGSSNSINNNNSIYLSIKQELLDIVPLKILKKVMSDPKLTKLKPIVKVDVPSSNSSSSSNNNSVPCKNTNNANENNAQLISSSSNEVPAKKMKIDIHANMSNDKVSTLQAKFRSSVQNVFPVANVTPMPKPKQDVVLRIDAKSNGIHNNNDDCIEIIDDSPNQSISQPPPALTIPNHNSTVNVLRYQYIDSFITSMDSWSFAREYLSLDDSVSRSSLTKFYIRLYDDRMLGLEGRFLLLHQYEPKSRKRIEKLILQHKLKVIKSYILKEIEKRTRLQEKQQRNQQDEQEVEILTPPASPPQPTQLITIALDVRDVNLFLREPQDFIQFFAQNITHLSFGRRLYSNRVITENTLFHLLTSQLPGLTYLYLDDNMLMPWNDKIFFTRPPLDACLPNLKTLRLKQSRFNVFTWKFIYNLLKQSPNISAVYGIPLHLVYAVECSGRMGSIVKSVSGVYRGARNLKTTSISVDPLLDVRDMAMETLDLRSVSCISKAVGGSGNQSEIFHGYTEIIKLNCHTLKKLKLRPLADLPFIGWFGFPMMESVETLQLFFEKEDQNLLFFPIDWEFFEIFPSVTNIEIKFSKLVKTSEENEEEEPQLVEANSSTSSSHLSKRTISPQVFPQASTFWQLSQDVNHLKVTNMESGMDRLAPIFLNITKLTIVSNCFDLNNNLRHVFGSWPRLKCLQIDLDVKQLCCLDSAILGIEEGTLKHFKRAYGLKETSLNNIKKCRKYPSITDLTDLRLFRISFKNYEARPCADFREQMLFSRAAGLYGFGKEMMPNLNVIVRFDNSLSTSDRKNIFRVLEPIRSYVSIDI